MIWQLVRKMYITATNSYNKYCALFGKRKKNQGILGRGLLFLPWLQIKYGRGEGLRHPILQRVITGLRGKGDTHERRLA